MNADTFETVCGSNGSEADDGSCEDIETRLRDMGEIVDEIERNYRIEIQRGFFGATNGHSILQVPNRHRLPPSATPKSLRTRRRCRSAAS